MENYKKKTTTPHYYYYYYLLPSHLFICVAAYSCLMWFCHVLFVCVPRSGELRTQKLKSHPVRTQSLNKCSPFKAWSRSVYSHTCYAFCQGFLPCLFLPFQSIHLHFFQNLSQFFPVLALANTGSSVGLQTKIGQPA